MSDTEEAAVSCLGCLAGVALYAGINVLVALAVQFLWNAVMPTLFHTPPIGYFPAFALCMLLIILGNLLFPWRNKE